MKEFTVKDAGPDIEILRVMAEILGGEGTVERIQKLTKTQNNIDRLMRTYQHIPRSVIKEYNKIISELYPERHE